jgi:hypothetical protein
MEEIIIEVVDVVENDDGAEIILNLNEAGQNLLMEQGLISILKDSLSEDENENCNCDRTTCTDVGCQC